MISKNPSSLIIWLSVSILALIWGSTWLAIKIGLTDAPPLFTLAVRFIIAAIILYVFMRFKKLKLPRGIKFWTRSFLLTLVMFIIPYTSVYWAETHISSGLSSVLFASESLFVVVFSHFMLKNEKASFIKWAGLLIGMLGLVYIFYSRFALATSYGMIAMVGLIIGAISAALSLVWLMKISEKSEYISELTSQIIITALLFTGMSLVLEEVPQNLTSPTTWICITYLALIGTVVAFLIFYWLAKYTSALILSFSMYFTPVLALFLGWLVLDEYIFMSDIIGTFVVIISIIITQLNVSFNPLAKRGSNRIIKI